MRRRRRVTCSKDNSAAGCNVSNCVNIESQTFSRAACRANAAILQPPAETGRTAAATAAAAAAAAVAVAAVAAAAAAAAAAEGHEQQHEKQQHHHHGQQ